VNARTSSRGVLLVSEVCTSITLQPRPDQISLTGGVGRSEVTHASWTFPDPNDPDRRRAIEACHLVPLPEDRPASGPASSDRSGRTQGRSNSAIGADLRITLPTVRKWRTQFLDRRLEGLTDDSRSGAPRAGLDESRLQELAHQIPRVFGKKTSTWTLKLLAEAASETGIAKGKVSPSTISRAMKRLGVTWRRAALWVTSHDPHYAEKKARRDRFIQLASEHPEWVLGFLDEVWWSRLARPPLRAWSAGDPMKLHVLSRPESDPDPVAICCYGLLRQDTNKVMLRFVEGRPSGDVTAQFLAWVCEHFGAEGKTRLIVVWDDASWHSGRPVSDWVAEHNRRVEHEGGVEIVLCPLPVKSPWLNNIETRWGPAKRAILEPDRILTGQEVLTRVCEHFGVSVLPYLKSKVDEKIGSEAGP
jgi:transposase